MDKFYSGELLKRLEELSSNQTYDQSLFDVYFENTDSGNLVPELCRTNVIVYDLNEIYIKFCENGLPYSGIITLMTGCFFYNNFKK